MKFLKNKSLQPKIFPFYPNRNLQNDVNFKIYKTYLDKVFKDKNVKNIAVTGNFGVGKSSILYSYDIIRNSKLFKIRKKSKFLYVSLMDFLGNDGFRKKSLQEKNCKTNDEINSLERNLIYQIFARCKEKDIPESSCEKYKEKNYFTNFYVFLVIFLITMLLIFNFKEEFQSILTNIFSVHSEKFANIYVWLYLIFGSIVFVFLFLTFKKIIHKIELRSINIKTGHADVDIGIKTYNTYIDYNKIELVYVLTQISKKIDYTVVFEDMDRLNNYACIEIFSKLRDINTLVNIRLKNKRKPIRFIYVINDKIFNAENRTKFFDYILPIIPPVSHLNSEKILKLNLESVGINNFDDEFMAMISEVLYDYRKINSIFNEYQVFKDIYVNNKVSSHNNLNIEDSEILAFIIYKTLCPQDYFKLRSGEGELLKLLIDNQADIRTDKYFGLIKYFVHRGILTENVLGLLGNSDDYIKKSYVKKLKSQDDLEKISAVKYLLKEDIVCKDAKKIINENYFWKQKDLKLQALLLCYMIINERNNCDWFFQTSDYQNADICQKIFFILSNVPDSYLQKLTTLQGETIENSIKACLKTLVLHDSSRLPSEGVMWQRIAMFLGQEPLLEMAIGNHPIIIDGKRKTINDEIMKYKTRNIHIE